MLSPAELYPLVLAWLQALGAAPPLVRQVVAQWTTTGRLSVWARGRLALAEPSGQLAAPGGSLSAPRESSGRKAA
jgi:hypothetical protein